MIGGILGGTAALRLGSALRHAEMESIKGRRVLIAGTQPKLYPVAGNLPEALAPGYADTRPVDVLAESYASVQGASAASLFFSGAAISVQGGGVHRNSNDVYWFESMRSGLASLFRIAGLLACREGETRSLNKILCDCFDDLNDAVCRTPFNGTPERPDWLDGIPEGVRRPIVLNYLGKATPAVFSHLSTVAVAVEELRRGAPARRTIPFAAFRAGGPIFLYTPSWGNAPLNILLRICMNAGYVLFLPEVHLWPETELLRVGHALKYGASACSVVWTSLSVPAHPAFESDWEIYGKSSSSDVLGLFRARLDKYGAEGETRLKELRYETPASLDACHALQRSPSGWSIVPCTLFDERSAVELEKKGGAILEEDIFMTNMAEIAASAPGNPDISGWEEMMQQAFPAQAFRETGKTHEPGTERALIDEEQAVPPSSPESSAARARIIEGVAEKKGSGKYTCCRMGGETLLLKDVPLAETRYVAVLGREEGTPQTPLAFYGKLWSADIPPEKEIAAPRIDAFVSVVIDPGIARPGEDGTVQAYSPRYRRPVRLEFYGLSELPPEKNITVFGTWKEPRSVLLVRSLLKPLAPNPPSAGASRRVTRPLTGRWKDVHESGERLRDFMNTALDGFCSFSPMSAESRETLSSLRSAFEENATLAMNRLHEEGKPVRRLENSGVVRMDMQPLGIRDEPWERLCAADISGLPPAGYRELLKRSGDDYRYFRAAFDTVVASLLLNLDANGIERKG